ncbi:PREDICTED: kelch-like protein 12 [Branchiostoma belcheri]|uniref:Kelch-like protein 12 n=1 Tax=Branchiostoma belcheri TaxID=7741 RepID=A0A6P4ZVJ6_BRABE|nr:PREDICTED: kelch-like protein 12 [Branchiostoma belcheri]
MPRSRRDLFNNYAHARELLAELASQRETREFLDVVVQVEGKEFPCHRAVLASTRYFKTMLSSNLSESDSEVIQLCGIDSTSFSKILDFLYTGEIRIGKDDVQDILQTAHMLQLEKIVEYCREFIQDNLCQSNCLGVMSLADLYGFSALKKKARDMSVASAGRHLYVTGGRVYPLLGQGPHSAPSKQAFRYDFPSDTWLRLPDMPRGRARHQSVVVDGKLFVVGGDAEATSSMTMDCYDPVEGAWIKILVRPPLRTASTLKVTAFRDKVLFIEVQKGTDDRPIDVRFSSSLLLDARRGYRIHGQRSRNQEKLCVHSLDVKTNVWRRADTYVPRRSVERVDIIATTVQGKLYIRTSCTKYDGLYIFDAEEETLSKGNERDWKEDAYVFRSFRCMNGQGIVGTIFNYNYAYGHMLPRRTPLPFAILGHSFLQTTKSSVGWYCRDLEALEKEEVIN